MFNRNLFKGVMIALLIVVATMSMPLALASSYQGVLKFNVSVDEAIAADGGAILRLGFHVENHTDNDVTLSFNTSQEFDYEIWGNGYYYHYADGRVFANVVTYEHVPAQGKAYLGMDRISLPFGIYHYRAYLYGYGDIYQEGYIVVTPTRVYLVRVNY